MYINRWEQRVNAGRVAEFVAYQRAFTEYVKRQPGFINRVLARSTGEPARFRAWARWESQEASEAAMAATELAKLREAHRSGELATLVDGPFVYEGSPPHCGACASATR